MEKFFTEGLIEKRFHTEIKKQDLAKQSAV